MKRLVNLDGSEIGFVQEDGRITKTPELNFDELNDSELEEYRMRLVLEVFRVDKEMESRERKWKKKEGK